MSFGQIEDQLRSLRADSNGSNSSNEIEARSSTLEERTSAKFQKTNMNIVLDSVSYCACFDSIMTRIHILKENISEIKRFHRGERPDLPA